jgi:subtilisin family serine protease
MKKSFISLFLGIVIILSLLNTKICSAQEIFSYYQGKKQIYYPSESKIVVRFKKETNSQTKNQIFDKQLIKDIKSGINGFSLISLKTEIGKEQVKSLIKAYQENDDVLSVSPILLNEEKEEIGALTEQFIVRLKATTSIGQLQRLATQTRTQIMQQYEYDKQTYILSISKNSQGNALEMANLFYESNLFEWAEPDLLLFINKSLIPNDASFGSQWSLRNIGQVAGAVNDADIDADEAWDITTGNSNIRIAIVDDGVQLNHPDLSLNILSGYDATGNNTGGNHAVGNEGHGTAVAGVAAARGNNTIGIAGLAYNCRIIPINGVFGIWDATNATIASWLTNGIDWAWNQGSADVINLSFKIIGSQQTEQSVNDAINRAVTQGRAGRGCVVVAATGNDFAPAIAFPASNPNVIAVGATTQSDERAGFSNYGTGIDISAPGALILTTDRTGLDGYNKTVGGDYTQLNGTSFATPLVAGTAALILSLNSNLPQSQVRRIIELTAEKKGVNPYQSNVAGQPNGTWNQFMGHGRLNTHQALVYTQNNCLTTSVSSSLISVSGAGMTVTQSGLNLAVVYNGSFISSTPNSQNIEQVEWQSLSGSVYVSQSGVTATAFPASGCVGGVANMRVRVRNVCNIWSDWRMFTVNVCSSSGFRFLYSPNPTSDVLDITAEPTEENKNLTIASSIDFEVKLIDADGRTVREAKNLNKERKLTFDVKGLKEGIYFLHIAHGKEIEKHQIVVGKATN